VFRIRDFRLDDIPQVAGLWMRTWREPGRDAPDSLLAYFKRIYFENPWVELNVPALVHETVDGEIDGFVGIIPRPMSLNGRNILVAVSCGMMVAPEARGRGIGLALRERSFQGPQDLLFTDGAAETARSVWEKAGGQSCSLYSCRWSRTLRPAANLVGKLRRRIGIVAAPFHYAAVLVDSLAMRSPFGAYRLPRNNCDAIEVDETAAILRQRDSMDQSNGLAPIYDEQSFDWLLAETAKARSRGELEKVIVTDESGQRVGWYVYFAKRHGIGDVMQIGGDPEHIEAVIGHMMNRARDKGSVALEGQLDARYARELTNARCNFRFTSSFFAYSQDPEIMCAVHSGQTSLSRLDGEWWLHFADGPW